MTLPNPVRDHDRSSLLPHRAGPGLKISAIECLSWVTRIDSTEPATGPVYL